MPDLQVSGKNALVAFERAGFSVVRTKGSHCIMKRPGHRNRLSIPVHGGKNIPPPLLDRLIKDAGLTREQFRELL